MVNSFTQEQTPTSLLIESPNNILLSDFTHDPRLIREIENNGKQWVVAIYTNRLNSWKQTWKNSRFGEGRNQTDKARLRLRLPGDILLTEGMVVQTPSLDQIENAEVIFSNLNGPMNSDTNHRGKVFFPCSQEIVIGDLNRKQIERRITNPLFNDLHSVNLNREKGSALVVSSGADKIIEIHINSGDVLWQWDAAEFAERYGLVKTETKERRQALHDVADYRRWVIPTTAQVTHVNTATWLNEEQIGVTLFHQGIALYTLPHNSDHWLRDNLAG